MTTADRDTFHMAVFWYGVDFLPRLRCLSFEERQQLLQEADAHSLCGPLHATPKARFLVPSWSEEPLTGGEVVALLVFGLWVQCGEDEQIAGALLNDWPEIRAAVILASEDARGDKP